MQISFRLNALPIVVRTRFLTCLKAPFDENFQEQKDFFKWIKEYVDLHESTDEDLLLCLGHSVLQQDLPNAEKCQEAIEILKRYPSTTRIEEYIDFLINLYNLIIIADKEIELLAYSINEWEAIKEMSIYQKYQLPFDPLLLPEEVREKYATLSKELKWDILLEIIIRAGLKYPFDRTIFFCGLYVRIMNALESSSSNIFEEAHKVAMALLKEEEEAILPFKSYVYTLMQDYSHQENENERQKNTPRKYLSDYCQNSVDRFYFSLMEGENEGLNLLAMAQYMAYSGNIERSNRFYHFIIYKFSNTAAENIKLINDTFVGLLMNHSDDSSGFEKTWYEMLIHPFYNTNSKFPLMVDDVVKLFKIAKKNKQQKICDFLIK